MNVQSLPGRVRRSLIAQPFRRNRVERNSFRDNGFKNSRFNIQAKKAKNWMSRRYGFRRNTSEIAELQDSLLECIECLNIEFLNLNDRTKNMTQDDSVSGGLPSS